MNFPLVKTEFRHISKLFEVPTSQGSEVAAAGASLAKHGNSFGKNTAAGLVYHLSPGVKGVTKPLYESTN